MGRFLLAADTGIEHRHKSDQRGQLQTGWRAGVNLVMQLAAQRVIGWQQIRGGGHGTPWGRVGKAQDTQTQWQQIRARAGREPCLRRLALCADTLGGGTFSLARNLLYRDTSGNL